MKIGLFTDTYYPQINGVATSVLMLKENLLAHGHQVYVFTTTDSDAPSGETDIFRVPSIPFVSAKRMGMFYHPRLAQLIRGLGLDLIHTHTEFSLGIFGRVMSKALEIPLLHTMHTLYEDYTHYIVKLGVLDPIAKLAAKKISASFCNSADSVIAPTDKIKDLLLSYGVTRRIGIIPTGIDLGKFSKSSYDVNAVRDLRAGLGIGAGDKILLYIGRLAEEKNIGEMLAHMEAYLKGRDDVKFVLVGDGPDKKNLEELTKKLGICRQTIFAGERPWDEIGIYYQLGDVFISASQSETQGLTYIEALASGLPVVAKADRCLDGVLQDGVNGYAFYGQDDFLRALDSVLSSGVQRERLSLGAVRSAERFSAPYFACTVEALYESVLARARGECQKAS